MPRLAFTFDLDTVAMKADGLTDSDRTTIYQREAPRALAELGFNQSPEGSVYCTGIMTTGQLLLVSMDFANRLRMAAPQFCKYIRSAHLFQMDDDMANVTTRLKGTVNF